MIVNSMEIKLRRFSVRQTQLTELKLNNITQTDVADRAKVSQPLVCGYFKADNNNKKIRAAVEAMLKEIGKADLINVRMAL